MAKPTVAENSRRIDANQEAVLNMSDKIDAVMEHLLEDRAALDEHVKLLRQHIESDKDLRDWLGNGFTKDVGRIAGGVAADIVEARFKQHQEEEREEYIKKLESTVTQQTERNREYGAERDAEQKRQANQTKIWTGVISAVAIVVVALIQVLGG